MEELSLCFLAVSTLVLLWFLKLAASSSRPGSRQLPPGPWTLPVIGSLHHLLSPLLHRKLMELSRRHGPLMFLKLGEVPTLVVSSAEAAKLVMRTHDLTFADRAQSATLDVVGCGGRGIIFSPYGEHWRQMRKLCIVELLSARQVRRMVSVRAEEVARLLRSVAAGSPVNVSEKVSALSNDVISRALFGGRCARQEEFFREFDVSLALMGTCLVDLFPSSRLVRWLGTGERKIRRSYGRIQRIIADIIDERRALRRGVCGTDDEDLLDVLLRLQQEDSLPFPLTTEIIGVIIFDMFGAATDTSRTTLDWAMSELLNNPIVLEKAQLEVRKVLGPEQSIITNNDLGELQYMRMVIKEVFRLHPPVPLLIPRETRQDIQIMDYDVPKGTKTLVNIFAISRDPRYWDNPEEFIPERFENSNVDYNGTHFEFTPFGAGRRQCPGMLFGTSTVEMVLANLLYHFNWELIGEASSLAGRVDMSEKFAIGLARKSDLQLKSVPYIHSKAM